MTRQLGKERLEELYREYNRRSRVHPDPVEFLYRYERPEDREVVALIAACLAYGRVGHILRSVGSVLERMGPSPARFVDAATALKLSAAFDGFRHRFSGADELTGLLLGIGEVRRRHGTLDLSFRAGMKDQGVAQGLSAFVSGLAAAAARPVGHLLPVPAKGSACKRLHLFLRWMVRQDNVDPGGWTGLAPSDLIVPLDTHMHRIGLALGFTSRKAAGLRTALEITDAFRAFAPDDPVRYDFALTRLAICSPRDLERFLIEYGKKGAHD